MFSRFIRIFSIEYFQNWFIVVGVMVGLRADVWWQQILMMGVGAFATSIAIFNTERIKLQKANKKNNPHDWYRNGFFFWAATLIYWLYFVWLRPLIPLHWIADLGLGVVLGTIVGISQGFYIDRQKFDRQAILHTIALALAAIFIVWGIGWFADMPLITPLVSASIICLFMTLAIMAVDYSTIIQGK